MGRKLLKGNKPRRFEDHRTVEARQWSKVYDGIPVRHHGLCVLPPVPGRPTGRVQLGRIHQGGMWVRPWASFPGVVYAASDRSPDCETGPRADVDGRSTRRGELMVEEKMTKRDRDELGKILKARGRVAHRVTDHRAKELLADVERQLAARYEREADVWEDLIRVAEETVEKADAELAERCRVLGIPERFRPQFATSWYGRGENASKERRAELRKVAQTRIEALAAQARVTIETTVLDGLTMLTESGLVTEEARGFLKAMPTVETLMPVIDVSAIDPLALTEKGGD